MSPHPSPVRRGRRRTAARLAPVLLLTGVLATGCDGRDLYERSLHFGFPKPITEQGESIYELWLGTMAAAVVVGAFVAALIVFAALRYRKRTNELPRQVRYNLPIEILYTAVPFVIIAVLFFYTVESQNKVNALTPEKDGGADVQIGVVGFQWNWQFQYLDDDVQVTGETEHPAQLVLPTGRTIRFTETSPDVIHSFWVPEFLFKRDVVPGRKNQFEITINKTGTFIGHCAEFCGEKHSFMNFSVKVVSPDEYDRYIAGLKRDPAAALLTAPAGASDGSSE